MRSTAAVRTAAFAVLLACSAGVRAADDEPQPDGPSAEATAQPEPDPEPVRGIRYRVWMRSGRSMEGVVRAKGVFEITESGGAYRAADEDEKGAGIRLWFPRAQDGFIFVPLSDVKRLEELGELSSDEGRSIARARVDAAKRAESERFQIKARRAAEEAAAAAEAEGEGESGTATEEAPADGAEPAAKDGETAQAEPGLDAGKAAALLLEFPPTRWTLDSPSEIERRKVVLGLFPSEEEKRFLSVFDDWKVAYTAWAEATAEAGAKEDGAKPATSEPTAKSEEADAKRARPRAPRAKRLQDER